MQSNTLPPVLRAPRVPARPPVNVVQVSTVVMHGGVHQTRQAFIVNDHEGQLVEILSGDDNTESRLFARWPWFSTQLAPAFGIARQSWSAAKLNVSPAEYRRVLKWEPWTENAVRLRALADRCERHSAVVEALSRVRIDGSGDHPLDGPRAALIYQRTRKAGGDDISEHLRRAMTAAERIGMVENVSEPGMWTATVKRYRATDTTPYTLGA